MGFDCNRNCSKSHQFNDFCPAAIYRAKVLLLVGVYSLSKVYVVSEINICFKYYFYSTFFIICPFEPCHLGIAP